jgi:hypothetical protein
MASGVAQLRPFPANRECAAFCSYVMHMRTLRFAALILCGIAAACFGNDAVRPMEYPAYSLTDTVHTYVCGGWTPRTPPAKRVLVDVRFWPEFPTLTPPSFAPYIIERLGGEIIYVFNVSTIRAAMDVDSIASLKKSRDTQVDFVETVVEPDDYTVFANVTLMRAATEADLTAVRGLGATDAYLLPPGNMLRVTIADGLIPALRSMTDVQYVNWGWGIGCLL